MRLSIWHVASFAAATALAISACSAQDAVLTFDAARHDGTDGPVDGMFRDVLRTDSRPDTFDAGHIDANDATDARFDVNQDGASDGNGDVADSARRCLSDADCSDHNACNGVEACVSGVCSLGTPLACNDGLSCTIDTCVPATGCRYTPNDGLCSDGLFCDGVETCNASAPSPGTGCLPGTAVACPASSVPCNVTACNEAAMGCASAPSNALCPTGQHCDRTLGCQSGAPCTADVQCDDSNPCNGIETCDLSTHVCSNGTMPSCDDGLSCTVDSCDPTVPLGCVHTPNHMACSDGLFCTGVETCSPTAPRPGTGCIPGTHVVCPAPSITCDVSTCSEATSSCVTVANNALCPPSEHCDFDTGCQVGTPCSTDSDCSDGNPCSGTETCNPTTHTCVYPPPLDCDDGVSCTVDTCTAATGCQHAPNNAACSDGQYCNGVETCDATPAVPGTGCRAGTPINCDDGIGCTVDTCSNALSTCQHAPNDAACADGSFCNGTEVCDPSAGSPGTGCAPGVPVTCAPSTVACDSVSCSESAMACVTSPDNSRCTGMQHCDLALGCQSGGACNTNSDCDDHNPCNGVETCNSGTHLCVYPLPPTCNDGLNCTMDVCDPTVSGGCVHIPYSSLCSDGLYCNGVETCDPTAPSPGTGCRAGTPMACDDGVPCTVDTCNDTTASCVFTATNSRCSGSTPICSATGGCVAGCGTDGATCTSGATCCSGMCLHGQCHH